ncbi:MAG: mannose-1-phosphate guanylyltransferase, partial [Boseongicola sp.]
MKLHPVILCGGSGTRLWPSSRKSFPKQFAPLLGEKSLYQDTLTRLSGGKFAAPVVMTGEDFRFMAVEQAEALGCTDARVVVEPVPRDTAPAILAAAITLEDNPEDLILVAPSDHMMVDVEAFHEAIQAGYVAAEDGALVTFGVTPDRPETGYGYLQLAGRPDGATSVTKFTEKPDLDTAKEMVEAGHYLWNAGLFMGRVKDFIAAFEKHAPDLINPVRAAVSASGTDLNFRRLDKESFGSARAISLDYAIMEKAEWVVAVPLDCGWTD